MFLVFFGSRKSAFLTTLFGIAVLLLFIVTGYQGYQMKGKEHIILPIGQEKSKASGLTTAHSNYTQEILILNSYHMGHTFSDNEMAGIIETLQKGALNIQPIIEHLDCKYYPKMEHFERVKELFKQKYSKKKFPIVIVTDNPALEFALKYRSQIFPDSSIVFCGINGFKKEMIEGHKNITGIAEVLNADDTMEIALKLHPKTREVFVLYDYTTTGLATRRRAEEQLKGMSDKVAFRYLENMTIKELAAYVKKLPQDSLVLTLSYSVDKDGAVVSHKNIAKLLSTNSPVPVYGLHEERIGYGIVGGSLLGGKLHGANAAEIALKIMAGERASNIPVKIKSPTRMMFDYNQLVRFGIPIKSLPEGSIIVNRPISFIARHLGLVITTLLVVVILISGIIILGFNIYQRHLAENALKEAMAFNESTLNAIADIFYAFDLSGKMLIWNKAASRITGYSDTELSSKKPTDFFSGEDVQRVAESIERVWKEGSAKVEAKLVLKDGRQVPYEFAGSILKDSKDNIIAFSGIGRDITKRKRAEAELENLISELKDALANVKTLSGLLPICASCKKIRDDKGYWNQIEAYISEHSEAEFTHGMCPDCAKKAYEELDKLKKRENEK